MERTEIYQLIDVERAYQDKKAVRHHYLGLTAINRQEVFTSTEFNTGKVTVASVQSVEIVSGTPTNFGAAVPAEAVGKCEAQ